MVITADEWSRYCQQQRGQRERSGRRIVYIPNEATAWPLGEWVEVVLEKSTAKQKEKK